LGSFSSRIPSSTFDIFQPKKIHGEKNDTSSSGSSSNGGGYYQLF
jgi:hypothetical protein